MYSRTIGSGDGAVLPPLSAPDIADGLPDAGAAAGHLRGAGRLIWRLPAFVALTLGVIVAYLLLGPYSARGRRALARTWNRGSLAIIGLRLRVEGAPVSGRPILYTANHVSYLDIPLLGAALEATFVAKAEVAGWPVFGTLAKLRRTIMVTRRPAKAAVDCHALGRALLAGRPVVLFPEGTSTDGRDVKRFKSTLFEVAYAWTNRGRVDVQPVSLAYAPAADGGPSPHAWYGDLGFASHFLRVMMLPPAEVRVRFHPPVRARRFECRKALARHCQAVVADGLADLSQDRVAA